MTLEQKSTSSCVPVKARTLDWIFWHEEKFTYHPQYPLSRLYPYLQDKLEFNEFMGSTFFENTSWLQQIQTFIDWLTDREMRKNFSACYYIALTGRLLPENTKIRDERSSDYRRFCSN